MTKIKNIIFDVGNVLIEFDPTKWLIETYGPDMETITVLYREVFQSEEWKLLDARKITPDEAFETITRRLVGYDEEVSLILFHWENFLIQEMPISVYFMRKFKAMGLNIYALSNYPERGFENTEKFYPFFKLFDGKVVSYTYQEMKPEKKIFEILMEKYQLDPKECVFIDDTFPNVETARELGMEGVHFYHNNHLMNLYLRLMTEEKTVKIIR